MEADGDILGTRHAAAILRYVLRNDGCILRDMREDVTGNCSTVLAVCSKLRDSGLLETEDVRSRPDTGRRSTVYHLTPKGRRAAMLLDAASSVIEEDGRIDSDELDAFLDSVFRKRTLSQSGDRPRTQIEELESIAEDRIGIPHAVLESVLPSSNSILRDPTRVQQ